MGRLLGKCDIGYDNYNFWWYTILDMRGCDHEKELNLDDAVRDVVDETQAVPDFSNWYHNFFPDDEADAEGYYEKPNALAGQLSEHMRFAIEFHQCETTYYLNDRYIGNLGGHFEAWFLSWDELCAFDRYEYLFLLLLPMAAIEQHQRAEAETLVARHLAAIPIFTQQAPYIARCIVEGLLSPGFGESAGVGKTSLQTHSVRNVERYPRYREDVAALNRALEAFVHER